MKLGIKRLLSHPMPRVDESIGSWIEKLAANNQVQFNTLYWHIVSFAKEMGLYQALKVLTGISVNRISCLRNEFKRDFWKDPERCPIKNCDIITQNPAKLSKHLQTQHNLGRKFIQCPYCNHHILQSNRAKLDKHIKLVHGGELKWWHLCPYCGYETIRKVFFIHHLIMDHGVKLPLVDCLYCDYLAENELDLESHLWKTHGVKEEYECPQCEYRSRSYTDFIFHLRHDHAQDRPSLKENLCPFCDYKTQDKWRFEHHLWIRHDIGDKWYICPDPHCCFKSKHQASYNRHLKRTAHGAPIKKNKRYNIRKINNKYQCPKCSNMESIRWSSVCKHLQAFHNVKSRG